MLAFVNPPAFDKIIAIGCYAAFETASFHQLMEAGFGSNGGFLAFSIGLPETDVIQQFIGMVIEPLLPFLGAPDLNAVADKPLHHKWGFIRNSADSVKHEHQKNIKFPLKGMLFDDLQLVPVFRSHLMAGNAFFLLLMDDLPSFFRSETMAGLALHGNISSMVVAVVHLFVCRNTVKTINSHFFTHHDILLTL